MAHYLTTALIVFVVSVSISVVTYFASFTVLTWPVIAAGMLIVLREVLAYANGSTTTSATGTNG